MSVVRCSKCETYIDTDYDVEMIADWDKEICVNCVSDPDGSCTQCKAPAGVFTDDCPCCVVRKEESCVA